MAQEMGQARKIRSRRDIFLSETARATIKDGGERTRPSLRALVEMSDDSE